MTTSEPISKTIHKKASIDNSLYFSITEAVDNLVFSDVWSNVDLPLWRSIKRILGRNLISKLNEYDFSNPKTK